MKMMIFSILQSGISIVSTVKPLSDYLEEILAFDKGITTVSSSKSSNSTCS